MGRLLFHLLTVVSLLLFLAAAVFWARGYVVAWEFLKYQHAHPRRWSAYQLASRTGGQIDLVVSRNTFNRDGLVEKYGPDGLSYHRLDPEIDPMAGPGSLANRLGLGLTRHARTDADGTYAHTVVQFPHWFLMLLTAIPPTIWLMRWRRSRLPVVENGCRVCGYDLRATPDRCPECGTAAGKPFAH